MRKVLAVLAMTMGLVVSMANRADAQTMGPFCFAPLPFADRFVLFFTPNGANQLIGTGRNVTTGNGVSATAILSGSTAILSFVSPIAPTGTGHTFMGTANISLGTGSGPGRCEAVNTTAGCGVSSSITMTTVSCPAGALSGQPAVSGSDSSLRLGPLMDGSSPTPRQ